MNNRSAFSIGMLFLLWLSSCSGGDNSFEARRNNAIRSRQAELASTTNAVRRKWGADILSTLAVIDAKSVAKPQIASAIVVGEKDGGYNLFVFWIEDKPSIEALEFRFSSDKPSVIVPIPQEELNSIRAVAKASVVFGCEYDWKKPSEVPIGLDRMRGTADLKVRLLRGKTLATDWFPVDFYKAGHWVSDVSTNK